MRQVVLIGWLMAATVPVFAQPDRLLVPIDPRATVVLKGNTNPKAQSRYDQGLMTASQTIKGIRVVAKLTASQQADLNQLLAEQQDPASSNYHNWLTPEQYAERFGLSASDVARITAWLGGQGFSVDYVARARNYLMFSGTAGQVQTTFQTEMHRYQVDSQSHYANSTDPSIPAALEPLVLAIQGLDDFRPLPQIAKLDVPAVTLSGMHYMSPGDFATIYNINPLYQQGYTGSLQSLVVVGQTEVHITDIEAFRNEFGLPANNPQLIPVPGTTEPGYTSDLPEASLDLEYSGGIAYLATVTFIYSSDVWTSAQYAIDQNIAPVISSSYGGCELAVSSDGTFAASLRQSAQQANAQGITWVSSSGDQGATACDTGNITQAVNGLSVNWPASIPEITGVGGTEFVEGTGSYWSSSNNSNGSSALGYIPEMAWNDTKVSIAGGAGISSTGGGASILYTKPTWQIGTGVPNDNARDVPDISFDGANDHDPYTVYVSGANGYYGGTSISTPAFAGVLTILNQYLVNNKVVAHPGLGNINPKLYTLAAPGNSIFHDITVGNNIVPCRTGSPDCFTGTEGYSSGIGYDQTTGLGSANVANLVTQWSGLTFGSDTMTLSASPASISTNGTTTLTATVKAASGSISPAGTVSFTWGLTSLGTATLSGSGGSATASISVYGSEFASALGAESISAYYGGSGSFTPASASVSLTVGVVTSGSAVVPSVVPNPVYQQTPDAQGYNYFFTIRLTETAGVATTLTGLTAFGQNYSSDIASFFGSASVPAGGTLSANLRATLTTTPQNVVFGFTGVDASGAQWTQQISVPFLPKQISAAMSLASAPSTVAETPDGAEGCSAPYQYFYQQLDLQELNGFEVELTRFLAGGNDYTQYIPDWFGSWRLAPFGSLLAGICWELSGFPTTFDYELDGVDTNGNNIVVTTTAGFEGPVANAGVLSTSKNSVDLIPGSSGTAQTTFTVNVPAGQSWKATVFPANPQTSWLVVFPLSGTGPGTVTVAGASAGLAPGVAQATLVIQCINTLPQFVEVPVAFTVGGSSSVGILGVENNFSYEQEESPGMLAVIFGQNLARTALVAASLPLPTVLGGTSATINGIPAPIYNVSPGQMDIQIPYETPAGIALLAVNNNGAVASYYLEIGETVPGIAYNDSTGLVASGDPDPGKRGGVFDMYITGEGDVTPYLATGTTPVGATPQARLPISVTIAGIPAKVEFNGIPSWSVGVTQLNVQVPANAPTGPQPLVVTVGGTGGVDSPQVPLIGGTVLPAVMINVD